jgi:transposase
MINLTVFECPELQEQLHVVPASELAAAIKEIKELQRLLGKKTMEVEILKEAVEWGRSKNLCSKNLIARSPLLPGDDL